MNCSLRASLCVLLLVLLTLVAASRSAEAAGPSNTEPYTFLPLVFEADLFRFGEVKKKIDRAPMLDEKIREGLAAIRLHAAAGDYNKISFTEVENLQRDLLELDSAGYDIRFWGEATGVDIGYRVLAYRKELSEIIKAMYKDPSMQRRIEARMKAAERTLEKQEKQLDSVDRFLDRKDYRRAAERLEEIRRPAEIDGVWWHSDGTYERKIDKFKRKYRTFYDEWVVAWQGTGRESLATAAKEITPNLNAFASQLNEASLGFATLNRVSLGGNEVNGPEAIELLAGGWLRYQRDLLQLRGVAYMSQAVKGELQVATVDEEIERLQSISFDNIAKIMNADAKRATPAEAEQLYFAYLEQLAKIVPLTDEKQLHERTAPAMQQLVDRSPTLRARVEAYRAATADLLRWRARVAAQQVEMGAAVYSPLLPTIAQAAVGTKELPGFVETRDETPEEASFSGPISPALDRMSSNLLEKSVKVEGIVNLGEGSTLGVSPYLERTQVYLTASSNDVAGEVEYLKSDLFVPDEVLPATWEAAVALETAARGDFVEAGGTISRIGAIGWAAYHTSMTDQQRGLFRLDHVEKDDDKKINGLVIRVIVNPDWVRHRYFFHALTK